MVGKILEKWDRIDSLRLMEGNTVMVRLPSGSRLDEMKLDKSLSREEIATIGEHYGLDDHTAMAKANQEGGYAVLLERSMDFHRSATTTADEIFPYFASLEKVICMWPAVLYINGILQETVSGHPFGLCEYFQNPVYTTNAMLDHEELIALARHYGLRHMYYSGMLPMGKNKLKLKSVILSSQLPDLSGCVEEEYHGMKVLTRYEDGERKCQYWDFWDISPEDYDEI
ncbi:MAG: hypothetical protein LUD01_04435 [Clostridiales bacterium]|nr:hypothetical protein [Clostridiales bacterium]